MNARRLKEGAVDHFVQMAGWAKHIGPGREPWCQGSHAAAISCAVLAIITRWLQFRRDLMRPSMCMTPQGMRQVGSEALIVCWLSLIIGQVGILIEVGMKQQLLGNVLPSILCKKASPSLAATMMSLAGPAHIVCQAAGALSMVPRYSTRSGQLIASQYGAVNSPTSAHDANDAGSR